MKFKLEYVWLDGYSPEPNLRSKVKIVDLDTDVPLLHDCPEWSFDGSSTQQADGSFSDCILKPVRVYPNPLNKGSIPSSLVLCEVINPDESAHVSNTRNYLSEMCKTDTSDYLVHNECSDTWFGFEQEYTIMKDGKPLGFPKDGYPEPQGKYYCGVGERQVHGRDFVDEHLEKCIEAGIDVTGTNAEVMLGQWEYQVFSKGICRAGDDLWISRYILLQMSEDRGFKIEFHPKPVMGDWNGSGLHTNFSNKKMREEGGERYFESIFNTFNVRHERHIEHYGSNNTMRLTGQHETQSIEKFSWGVSDRGASIRVPLSTAKNWRGYVEDRRPASNADPYKIIRVIVESLEASEELYLTLKNIYGEDVTTYDKLGDIFKEAKRIFSKELETEYREESETVNNE